jgi:hypothetical protein
MRTVETIHQRIATASAGCSIGDACTKFGKECDFLKQCCSPRPDYSGFKRGLWVPMTREWKEVQ